MELRIFWRKRHLDDPKHPVLRSSETWEAPEKTLDLSSLQRRHECGLVILHQVDEATLQGFLSRIGLALQDSLLGQIVVSLPLLDDRPQAGPRRRFFTFSSMILFSMPNGKNRMRRPPYWFRGP